MCRWRLRCNIGLNVRQCSDYCDSSCEEDDRDDGGHGYANRMPP
jgi:hypothetical protein